MMRRALIPLFALFVLGGCVRTPREVTFHADGNPEMLSAWGLFTIKDGHITPQPGMVTYELATPLFSDYAQKWRTVWMPKGVHATYRPDTSFEFPVGTIVTKTFYYSTPAGPAVGQQSNIVIKGQAANYQPGVNGLDLSHVRLIETRLLIRRATGWVALPYVWNADGSDATLQRTGVEIPLTLAEGGAATKFVYTVPNQNQCAGCHAQDFRTRAINPIGLKARHLNRDFPGEGGDINQLKRLVAMGYLTGVPVQDVPSNANWLDSRAGTVAQARAYLDINCSHCHNATGAARTSGLLLDDRTDDLRQRGLCKPPVAAGRGTGDRPFDMVPGHPDQSIITYRMQSRDPGAMMPEVGRNLTHAEGVALIDRYISAIGGACEAASSPAPPPHV